MTATSLPSDTSSLLVPVHLDAWVVDSQNQEGLAWYYADFNRLTQFQSPIPGAFDVSDASKPTVGVHLHWALPDALTHGQETDSGQIEFPLVPNRWLIARFNTPASGPWQCKLWVVHSDYLGAAIGTTAADLSGSGVTTITLQAPGAAQAIDAGTALELIAADGSSSATVTTAAAVSAGATQITIQPYDFSADLAAGSTVQLVATSAFLNPFEPTLMQVTPSQTTFNVNNVNIGTTYAIEAWEALTEPADEQLYLQAVGPGNVSFAAYVPFVKDVFSFTDTDLPPEGTGVYTYTYLVVGWYSNPQAADPLRGVTAYVPGVWESQQAWQDQTPAQRFQTLLDALQWSVQGDPGTSPPATSLYHGLAVDVEWPYSTLGNAGIDTTKVQVVVANTATDALSALVEAQAQQQANADPDHQSAWLKAGDVLAQLIQACMYDLLDEYGTPGGSALIQQQIEQAWFGSNPGGIIWDAVASVPQAAGQAAAQPQLTPDQVAELTQQLAALNQSQRDLDVAQRQLESLQANLYMLWLKVGRANSYGWGEAPTTTPPWGDLKSYMETEIYPTLLNQVWDQLCAVNQARAKLPDPIDDDAANQWANTNWSFSLPGGGTTTLAALGLKLKAAVMPRFWHPNDPVMLIAGAERSQKHGEDGRYTDDGTLTCRLPGQTITGVQISGQPAITVQAVQSSVNLDPYGPYTKIPSISTLVHEAFFVDPANAALMANAVQGSAAAISAGITSLLQQTSTGDNWIGTPPTPFAIELWEQAWSPLFLEWSVQYYPTGSGDGPSRQFNLDDWHFDGESYSWKGTGFDLNYFATYKGRTLLTPMVPLVFQSKLEQYLQGNPKIDSEQLEALLTTVGNWDLLSQSLSGFTDQLITLLTQETFPPADDDSTVACPRSSAGDTQPSMAALIGEQYQAMPLLQGGGANINYFYPVRGGFIQFQQLQIVDAFGQTLPLSLPNTTQGFQPLLGQDMAPSVTPGGFPVGMVQLAPRVVQSTRLNLSFLANDGSGKDILVDDNPNAVCGWLLPNHLDGGIAVYDADGILLGELLPLAAPDNWRPRPGNPGASPPPQSPAEIANPTLKAVVGSIAAQSAAVFGDLLTVIDETLWMVDPLGGRKDQFLSVLIGRPLAVVQAQVQLSLYGNPAFNQMWNNMLPAQPPYSWLQDTGDVTDVAFPVRLGSLELRDDGLIGYFLTAGDNPYGTFYAVHYPDTISAGDSYIRQIVQQPESGPAQYQGDIQLTCQGPSVSVTMLLDPRGSVHAYTGMLPVTSAALPAQPVEQFIKALKVTFQTGPIIADPGTLRLPKPAEDHGVWTWLQAVAPSGWEADLIVDANDQARFPDTQLQLREGWLQLSDINESDS